MPDFKTNNWYVVRRRWGAEERDLREWVQPNCYAVQKLLPDLPTETDAFILESWRYIAENLDYPSGFFVAPTSADFHQATMFGKRVGPVSTAARYFETYDFWSTPPETLASDMGLADCEDSTFCLVSLLLCRASRERVWATLGKYAGMYHAWAVVKKNGMNYILESTLDEVPWDSPWQATEEDNPDYEPYIRFNDRDVEEIVPIEKLDLTKEREGTKIKMIKEAWR